MMTDKKDNGFYHTILDWQYLPESELSAGWGSDQHVENK